MGGCNDNNQLDTNDFAKPLPVIGYYIAVASAVCGILMSLDVVHGIRKRRWFPCRWFPLNAITLTILTVAAKLPVDLNTPMPGRFDQLSKLSGTVLICTATCNFIPSLGNMGGSELASNVAALAILVITVVVNMCIQMRTGVVYAFLPEHIVVMMLMVLVLAILMASAIAVPTTKKILNDKYVDRVEKVLHVEPPPGMPRNDDYVKTIFQVECYWLLAHTANPQHVLGRSATCTASGAFCFLGVMVVAEAFWRSILHSPMFCSGHSDYGWLTTIVVCSIQGFTILMGAIGPVWRWLSNALSFRATDGTCWRCNCKELCVEEYWTKILEDWKKKTLPFNNESRRWRILKYRGKSLSVWFILKLQRLVVLLSKLVRLLSISRISSCIWSLANDSVDDEKVRRLRVFLLHLDGEDDLVDIIIRRENMDVRRQIEKGIRGKPYTLKCFIGKIRNFDNVKTVLDVPNHRLVLESEEPHNCWAMPIVILVTIAVALPDVRQEQKEFLMKAVYQGLRYVRFVEMHLDDQDLLNAREAADNLWKTLDVKGRQFDSSGLDVITIIRDLAHSSAAFLREEADKGRLTSHVSWRGEALASYCMYKMANGILQTFGERSHSDGTEIFFWIQDTISDIISMCLTNIPDAIRMECINGGIEEREERARNAALLLGELENILPGILAQRKRRVGINFDWEDHNQAYIDDWLVQIRDIEAPNALRDPCQSSPVENPSSLSNGEILEE